MKPASWTVLPPAPRRPPSADFDSSSRATPSFQSQNPHSIVAPYHSDTTQWLIHYLWRRSLIRRFSCFSHDFFKQWLFQIPNASSIVFLPRSRMFYYLNEKTHGTRMLYFCTLDGPRLFQRFFWRLFRCSHCDYRWRFFDSLLGAQND